MKIKTKELIKILQVVRPGLAKKEIVEQSTHFIFGGQNIVTYNDRVCISHPLKSDFHCSVQAEDFYKIVSNIEEEEIDLSFEKGEIWIGSKETRAGLKTLVSGEIEKLIDILNLSSLEKKWVKLPKEFIEGIFLCMFSASQDMTKGVLNSVSVGGNTIVSSDNLRISKYQMKDRIQKKFLLPLSSAIELVKFSIVEYVLTSNWIHFRTEDDVVFSSRIEVGDFPAIDSFLKVEGETFTFPDGLKKAVKDVSVIAEGEYELDKRIEVKIDKGIITCLGQDKNRGWIERDTEMKYKGEKIFFLINPSFFYQILEKSVKMTLGGDRALFVSEQFVHVMVLPVDEEKKGRLSK